jgi:hypothetical protein
MITGVHMQTGTSEPCRFSMGREMEGKLDLHLP